MNAPVVLLDGASMWFRSFFGVPSSITAPDGRPVNAVRGLLDVDDDELVEVRIGVVGADLEHRRAVVMIMELLDAFGIATGGAPGFEADDVLGTLTAREKRDPVIVVSGDRDLLQVVTDEPVPVRVLYLGRGLAKATLWGPLEVAEKYGLPAQRAGAAYAELAVLRGDPSDGLPGVAGIGEKTAAGLLSRYGSLDAVLTAAQDAKSDVARGIRAKLAVASDYLAVAGDVVRVATDTDVTLSTPTDALPLAAADPERVAALAETYGVSSSIARLQKALDSLD